MLPYMSPTCCKNEDMTSIVNNSIKWKLHTYLIVYVRVMYIAFIMIYGISGLLNAMRWRFSYKCFRTQI